MKKLLFTVALITASFTTFAQVGIGTTNPEGALDVVSTNSALILPRVANTAAVTTPVNGMIIYDLSAKCFKGYQDGSWTNCGLATDSAAAVVDVAGQNGTVWMDRNLGATRQATSSTDAAAYGDLYQWGRAGDGHQIRTSTTAAGPVASGSEGANFIIASSDWLTTQDDTLWQAGSNDPCPSGYRIPTEVEFTSERLAFSSSNAAGAYASALKLPVAGLRFNSNGTLGNVGSSGHYWVSTFSGTNAHYLYFNSSDSNTASSGRALGLSVRCIKE